MGNFKWFAKKMDSVRVLKYLVATIQGLKFGRFVFNTMIGE